MAKLKVAISQPMRGKTREQIEEERARLVKAIESSGNKYVNTILTEKQQENPPMWCLGASLQKMSKCDVVLFMPGCHDARGCKLELEACSAYGIGTVEFNTDSVFDLDDDKLAMLMEEIVRQANEGGG